MDRRVLSFADGVVGVDSEGSLATGIVEFLFGKLPQPEYAPKESAFYYGWVIEIPTPRWTAYEAKRFGIEMPDKVPMVTQERAYTSPIWFNP